MNKITLLTDGTIYLAFCLYCTQLFISKHIQIENYDTSRSYSPKDTVCYVSYRNSRPLWAQQLAESGFKIIVDHLWDGDVDTLSQVNNHVMILRNPNWLWYHSCAEWTHHGYQHYRPQYNYQHMFFMPMNRQEWHRDHMVNSLSSVLDQALWSYIAQGKTLPDDVSTTGIMSWRAYFNPDWYNTTRFSVVAESYMRTNAYIRNPADSHENYKTEVSEKIFKPMMGQHPFVVFGSAHTLQYLHREGFESFENLFDETYDDILEDQDRHRGATQSVLKAVDDWNHNRIGIDTLTQQKLAHNRNRLFDIDLVQQRVNQEIVQEILEFVER